MSIRTTRTVWRADTRTPAHKLVLLALADHTDGNGTCWPGLDRIAGMCGLSVRSVRRLLRDLEAAGHIAVAQRPGKSSVYVVATPDAHVTPTPDTGVPPTPDAHVLPTQTAPRTPVSPHPGHVRPPTPDTGVPLTTNEPSMNLKTNTRTDADVHAPDVHAHEFETWWTAYPRKIGKGRARTAYRQALTKTSARTLAAALQQQQPELAATEPRYVPHPATWLAQERWLDEPPATPTGNITRQTANVLRLITPQ